MLEIEEIFIGTLKSSRDSDKTFDLGIGGISAGNTVILKSLEIAHITISLPQSIVVSNDGFYCFDGRR